VNSCGAAIQFSAAQQADDVDTWKNCTSVLVLFRGKNPVFTQIAHNLHHKGADRYSCPNNEQNSACKQLTEPAQYS
jgi:hypothetical protein